MKRVSLPAEPESDITPVISPHSPHSPQDLFKEVRSILNRQTPQKFLQLVKQVKDSPIDTEEQLKGVVDLLFEKAMDETSSLVAYAKICNCLATACDQMMNVFCSFAEPLNRYVLLHKTRVDFGNIRFDYLNDVFD
ncbi:eukaryotic translation initiation factor 4 gamma 3-like [Platichthys flesus]|uniref:eukaryotic translation initiation factor 4 gamma 3-like n=1 Tax=Platichthys flesus TaxID=8260 RepID=UPI002DB67984|nr:eukaryotic translation initiation factor 4 gamma 3-like [Platichthys flesus]